MNEAVTVATTGPFSATNLVVVPPPPVVIHENLVPMADDQGSSTMDGKGKNLTKTQEHGLEDGNIHSSKGKRNNETANQEDKEAPVHTFNKFVVLEVTEDDLEVHPECAPDDEVNKVVDNHSDT